MEGWWKVRGGLVEGWWKVRERKVGGRFEEVSRMCLGSVLDLELCERRPRGAVGAIPLQVLVVQLAAARHLAELQLELDVRL